VIVVRVAGFDDGHLDPKRSYVAGKLDREPLDGLF
jgi:hypothetical protein